VAAVQVEAVADEELVGRLEPHVTKRQVVAEPAVRAVEERRDREVGGSPERERLHQVVQRQARVDDVLDQDDVPSGDGGLQILEQPDAAAVLRPRAVARERDEVERMRDSDRAREVAREDEASTQDDGE
jgi:hypothetical protein